jgi:hypothetical protein
MPPTTLEDAFHELDPQHAIPREQEPRMGRPVGGHVKTLIPLTR